MNYQQQAADFLAKHGISFSFKLANTKTPSWKNDSRPVNHFIVTLKQGKKRVSFDFFDSIANREKGITELDAYSVLSCCSSEIHCPETFEEFCSEFGYDEDSRKDEKTFKSLKKFSDKLKKFFDTEEMRDSLSEIC
jgi:hypothetical protein